MNDDERCPVIPVILILHGELITGGRAARGPGDTYVVAEATAPIAPRARAGASVIVD